MTPVEVNMIINNLADKLNLPVEKLISAIPIIGFSKVITFLIIIISLILIDLFLIYKLFFTKKYDYFDEISFLVIPIFALTIGIVILFIQNFPDVLLYFMDKDAYVINYIFNFNGRM